MSPQQPPYGTGDSSFRAAGGLDGLERLAADFYEAMSTLPSARRIRKMHPADISESRERLKLFLSGWLGGPRLYQAAHGEIRLPVFHAKFPIGKDESQAWLDCMQIAVDKQPYSADFKAYLMKQLAVPAERIRYVSEKRHRANREQKLQSG
ncbi:MAG: group II truncated hemoglobin [Pseudomonadota bacterium]